MRGGYRRCKQQTNGLRNLVSANPLQSSCLENPMDKVAQWAIVQGIVKSDTTERLSTHTQHTNRAYGTWASAMKVSSPNRWTPRQIPI